MSKKSFNLVYSTQSHNSFNFFHNLKKMNEVVLKFKTEDVINDFNSTDEAEIGRGNTYAVFPELAQLVENQEKITMDAFRHSLKARGVTDVIFQNKILSLVLQSKAGLQFALGNVLNGLLIDNNHMFLMQSDYNVNINVIDGQHIKLTLEGNWRNTRSETDAPDLKADITVDISSEKVSIESFQVTQLSNSPETKSVFKFLEANQAGLLEKIFIFLKNLFGYNADIEIENVSNDNLPWHLNAQKNKAAVPTTGADSVCIDERQEHLEEASFTLK